MNVVRLGPEYFPSPTNGVPVSLGSIYVGEPDTDPTVVINQKQISVLEENGTITPVAQPILTGAGGVPLYNGSPVTVFVDGDYSLTVLDKLGSQVYYVPSAETAISSDDITYNQGGTGALDRTVTDRLQERVSVLDFGATGDGVTDDTAAIQAAIDYAASASTAFKNGVCVYIPGGEYVISSTINVNVPQIHIKGDGFGTQLVRNIDYGTAFLVQTDTPDLTKLKLVEFSDFYVLSKAADNSGSIFKCNRCSQLWFNDVIIQDFYRGITLSGCDNVWLNHCDISSGQRYAATKTGSSLVRLEPYDDASLVRTQNANIYVNSCQLKQDTANPYIKDGLHILSVDGIYVTGSHIGFTESCITTQPFDDVANIQHVYMSSCYIDGNVEVSKYLLKIQDALTTPHTGTYTDIAFSNCGFVRPELNAVLINSDTVNHVSFSECAFIGGNEDGIKIQSDAVSFTFTSCHFYDWNRDNTGAGWDVRFLVGNNARKFIFNGCNFNSPFSDSNFAFGGSEDNITITGCIFNQPTIDGTTAGKTIILTDSIGLSSGKSENYGSAAISPDGTGNGVIAHGLLDTPSYSEVNLLGDTVNGVQVQSSDVTNLTVRIFDAAGADVTAGTFTVQWQART